MIQKDQLSLSQGAVSIVGDPVENEALAVASVQIPAAAPNSRDSYRERLKKQRAAQMEAQKKRRVRIAKIAGVAAAVLVALVCVYQFALKDFFYSVTPEGVAAKVASQESALLDATLSSDHAYEGFSTYDVAATGQYELVVQGILDTYDPRVTQLKSMLDNYGVDIGLVAWSTDGTRSISYCSTSEYFSACTIKAPYCYWVLHQIEAGNGTLDEVMTYEEAYEHGGSGTIRYGSYGDTYTIQELIHLCLSISDNVAYEMLVGRFGIYGYNQWISSLGLDTLNTGNDIWAMNESPREQAIAWEMIYNYLISNTACSNVMYQATYNSEYAYGAWTLPYNFNHKSGFSIETPAYNDCGIIWAEVPYVYAVLTNSGDNGDGDKVDAIMELVCQLMTS